MSWKEELYNLLVEHSVGGLTIGKTLTHEKVEDFISKTLKASQQQLFERLEKGKDGIDERIAYYQSLNEKDLPSYARNINSGRIDALNEVKALIQEEKERL